MEQLTTAESSNGTCQKLLVEPIEFLKDCLAQTIISQGQAIGDKVLYPSFPNVSESTLKDKDKIYFLEYELQLERETLEVKRQRLELSEKLQRLGLSQMQSQACKETSLQTLKDIEIKIYFLEYELQLERETLELKR